MLLSLTGATCRGSTPGTTPAQTSHTTNTPVHPGPTSLPYPTPESDSVRAQIDAGDFKKALADAEHHLHNGHTETLEPQRGTLHWMAARACEELHLPDRALGHWNAVRETDVDLAPWATLHAVPLIARLSVTRALEALRPLDYPWAGQQQAAKFIAHYNTSQHATAGARSALTHIGGSTAPPLDPWSRAEHLLQRGQYKQAEKAFEKLARDLQRRNPDRACEAKLQQGRAILRQRDRARTVAWADATAPQCPQPSVQPWVRYYGGRESLRAGRFDHAITHYRALFERFPQHRLADDALFGAAIASVDQDDRPQAKQWLEQLVIQLPHSDHADRARFRRAWLEYKDARLADQNHDGTGAVLHRERAVEWLAGGLLSSGDADEGTPGRNAYWHGNLLQDLGRNEEAQQSYQTTVTRWPVSYYAQLVHQQHPTLQDIPKSPTHKLPWAAVHRALTPYEQATSHRLAKLANMGEAKLVILEAQHSNRHDKPSTAQIAWLSALLHESQRHAQAISWATLTLPRASTETTAVSAALWKGAYPTPFAGAFQTASDHTTVSTSLLLAVSRTESRFTTDVRSSAGAQGLMQLMPATAARVRETATPPITTGTLTEPETNILLGATLIGQHLHDFGVVGVVPAAYNAGKHNAQKWITRACESTPPPPFNVWVEEIPYRETRRYTRKVLEAYGRYEWLHSGNLPPWDQPIPCSQ